MGHYRGPLLVWALILVWCSKLVDVHHTFSRVDVRLGPALGLDTAGFGLIVLLVIRHLLSYWRRLSFHLGDAALVKRASKCIEFAVVFSHG